MTERIGSFTLPNLDGYEVRPGIYLIGEPTPVPLKAVVLPALCVVELGIKLGGK